MITLTLLLFLSLADDVKPGTPKTSTETAAPAATPPPKVITSLTVDENQDLLLRLTALLREETVRLQALIDGTLGVAQVKKSETAQLRYQERLFELQKIHNAKPGCEWRFFTTPQRWVCPEEN